MSSLAGSVMSFMLLLCSSRVSGLLTTNHTIDCNHAVLDNGEAYLIADVCNNDGTDSNMLQCRDGEGFLMVFTNNDDCDENHNNIFEQALAGTGFANAVVCDADPCHIAVFEVYDGHDSDDSHGSDDNHVSEDSTDSTSTNPPTTSSTSTSLSSTTSTTPSSTTSTTSTTPSSTTSTTTSSTFDFVNGTESESSESHSAESGACDESGSPEIVAFIIDECQPIDSATIIISCSGTHDATVEYYPNDDCSGSATVTTTVEEFFGEFCATMVACNVEAGEAGEPVEDVQSFAPTPAPTSAPTDAAHTMAIFAPLLIAFAALLNA